MNFLIEWSDDEIIAQCMGFFLAGFDTASTLMCFTVHEITLNPDIQDKLFAEITAVNKLQPTIDYDNLNKMKYMDMVVSESLRKWTPSPATDRRSTKPFNLTISEGHVLKVNAGDAFLIPSLSVHMDPKYFPNPERFDPERFSKANIDKIVSGSYTPFGMGPRNCLGSRFAIMETKLVIYHLMSKFKFEKCAKTADNIRLADNTFALNALDGFWIQFVPR